MRDDAYRVREQDTRGGKGIGFHREIPGFVLPCGFRTRLQPRSDRKIADFVSSILTLNIVLIRCKLCACTKFYVGFG